MPRATPVVEPQGESKVLHEVAAHDEQQLQERLKASPHLLPIEDFRACGSGHFRVQREGRPLVASVEKMLEDARQLDLSSVDGCFRLGDLAEAMCRELPVAVDLFERLAIDLGVDRNFLTEAWYVATAFPPTTRPPGLPWASYLLLRFHAERHELAECAAREGWPQEDVERELAVRFAATHAQGRAVGMWPPSTPHQRWKPRPKPPYRS
jgi:hypothetical protein